MKKASTNIFTYKILYFVFGIFFLFISTNTLKADTIRMMHYNLMYYTNSTPSNCYNPIEYLNKKDSALEKVIKYVLPDVLCVCEMGSQTQYVNRFRNNVLNVNGINYYESCPLTNYSGGSIANMLYYDKRKLSFHSSFYISTSYRDINAYTLYYRSSNLADGDTAFITFLLAHLKAGSGQTNEAARLVQVQKLMARLQNLGAPQNYIFSGDFNLYSSEEEAYQHLINYGNSAYQFYDPIDMEENWHGKSNFAIAHTQSTHSSSASGECFSSGGLDDRFDFILVSPNVYYGVDKVKSINSSYYALGQDGERLNRSIISPKNSLIPEEIAEALYASSDHLPVIMDLEIDAKPLSINKEIPASFEIMVTNPIRNDLNISLHLYEDNDLTFDIYSVDGKRLEHFQHTFTSGAHKLNRSFDYPASIYFLVITDKQNRKIVKKIVK